MDRTTNGTQQPRVRRARRDSPALDVTVGIVVVAIASPVLALPVGLAWRLGRWAAGL